MNFPLENPIFQFFYWLVDTAVVGGVFALLVGGGSILAYSMMVRWIIGVKPSSQEKSYTFPTPALHEHERHDHN